MRLFQRKASPSIPYDPEMQQPALRQSICTGEMTVGFLDRKTGKFREYQLARDQREVEDFCRRAGVAPEDLKRFY